MFTILFIAMLLIFKKIGVPEGGSIGYLGVGFIGFFFRRLLILSYLRLS